MTLNKYYRDLMFEIFQPHPFIPSPDTRRGETSIITGLLPILSHVSKIFLAIIKIRGAAHNRVIIELWLRLNFIAIVGDMAIRDQKNTHNPP